MGDTISDTLAHIFNADDIALKFIHEWHNNQPYIEAHTSGSTGTPKKIQLLKQDMIESAIATCKFFGINKSSTLVLPLSSNYIAGKMMIVRAIVSGAKLWIEEPSNTPIKKDYGQIDLLPIVPSQIDWITNESTYTNQIRNLIIGGGAISPKREQALISSKINAFATYGMTETCSHIALRHVSKKEYTTLPDISISQDNRDCLVIDAPKFSFNRIITNDIVEIIDSTHFNWLGRYDNIINSGGIKIMPEQVEKKLSKIIPHPFYIIGENDDKWGEAVSLYIETTHIDENEIINKVSQILDRYTIPKRIKCIPKFERTPNGKIKRQIY